MPSGSAARRCGRLLVSAALVALFLAVEAAEVDSSSLVINNNNNNDGFEDELGDINYCKQQCVTMIKDKDKDKACYRGCRLYSICQFVNGNQGFNSTRDECQGACMEAYGKLVDQEACSIGCSNQPSEPEIQRRKLRALTHRPRPPSVVEAVSGWCSGLVSSAQSFISSTWTFYLQGDDGKVVVFQSQPEMEFTPPLFQGPVPRYTMDKTWTPPHTHTQKGVRGRGGGKGKRPTPANQHPETDPAAEHDFLGCMSRRSGLPRWILAACLFLSIMVMLWLSCASLVTAPDQHIKTQLSINGDREFLDDAHKVKVNPYPLSPALAVSLHQSESSEGAGPLPVKVDLDKTPL